VLLLITPQSIRTPYWYSIIFTWVEPAPPLIIRINHSCSFTKIFDVNKKNKKNKITIEWWILIFIIYLPCLFVKHYFFSIRNL